MISEYIKYIYLCYSSEVTDSFKTKPRDSRELSDARLGYGRCCGRKTAYGKFEWRHHCAEMDVLRFRKRSGHETESVSRVPALKHFAHISVFSQAAVDDSDCHRFLPSFFRDRKSGRWFRHISKTSHSLHETAGLTSFIIDNCNSVLVSSG